MRSFKLVLGACLFFVFAGLLAASRGACALIYEENYDQIVSPDLPEREGVELGPVILHAALKSGADFESNVFYADQGEKYDTISRLAPSIGIEIPMEENRLSLEYEAAMSFFNRYGPEQDHIDHKARMLLAINLTDFKIILDDVYRRFTNRAGSTEVGDTGTRTREERNDASLSVGAEFDKLAYKVTYENKMRKFGPKNEPLFGIMNYDDKNSMADIGTIETIYKFWPKTALVGEVSSGRIRYYSELVPSSYFIEMLGGFKADKWFNKLDIDFRIGTRYQDYGFSGFMFDDDFYGVVGRGQVNYSLTDDDTFGLTVERSHRESIYANINYYVANLVGVDYTHKFTDKIKGNLFFSWQHNRYPKPSTEGGQTAYRRDHTYRTGVGVRYDIQKWCSVEVGYEYRARDSIKLPALDYKDHVASVQATVGF